MARRRGYAAFARPPAPTSATPPLADLHRDPYPAPRVGVVDVFAVAPSSDGWEAWRILVLQRAAVGTRCPLAWEAIHGGIEPGERPEDAALRELREETGLEADRLYNVTTSSFYLHGRGDAQGTAQVAVAFCAFVDGSVPIVLGAEHRVHAWLAPADAALRFAWPREREALAHIAALLGGGDAGPLEDVLRVR